MKISLYDFICETYIKTSLFSMVSKMPRTSSTSGYSKRFRNTRGNARAAKKLQRWIRRKRSSRAQAGQLIKTNRRINAINAKLKQEMTRQGLYLTGGSQSYRDSVIMLQPALTAGTVSPAWRNCFSDSTITGQASRAKFGRCNLKIQFTCGDEADPVTYNIFHVRLKKKNAKFMTETFGNDLATIASPAQYVRGTAAIATGSADSGGFIYLNPDYFDIKKMWRFTLSSRMTGTAGAVPADATNAFNSYKNIDYSFPLGYTIGKSLGNWTTVSADTDTASELKNYILIFTNNNQLDTQSNTYSFVAQTMATGLT